MASSVSSICFLSARLSNSLFLTLVRIRHLTISMGTIVYNFLKNADFQKQGNAPTGVPELCYSMVYGEQAFRNWASERGAGIGTGRPWRHVNACFPFYY